MAILEEFHISRMSRASCGQTIDESCSACAGLGNPVLPESRIYFVRLYSFLQCLLPLRTPTDQHRKGMTSIAISNNAGHQDPAFDVVQMDNMTKRNRHHCKP